MLVLWRSPIIATMAIQLDADSVRWLEELRGGAPVRDLAVARLHTMLLGVARAEGFRRRPSLSADVAGDLDDLCQQAANDAVTAVVRKLDEFRGASRFTTWAYKFAVLEVSVRLRRRVWSARRVDLDEASWGSLAGSAPSADCAIEERELISAVRKAVETTLTEHQRRVFLAVVAEEIPIDVVADHVGSTRGAVYKVLHDARRKVREALRTAGHLETK
jgi:RNA polymerase sigma-70 factor (ECF subfamily)